MKGIDHIGIAVHSLEKALPLYTGTFQLSHIKTEVVESQKVKVAFIDVNNSKIELLEPTSDDSTIKKFLDKKGEGIHHIAFKTDDIYQELENLASQGVRLIDETPRIGAGGALVAFIHPKTTFGVLYELCQKQKQK
ncbi:MULTISPECIES: methylmalonyl-CoA epimerase [Bacillaceae]|nr:MULTISPECIES: methylmalonyl-CoA epimerase [Bacillaceae]MBU5341340.1 methylmalonyl-CoA epimerase [Caldifermentibacillus hisashii]MCB7069731.1 methylmalonyl-CoA epimerase [Caldibacillus sp. 210928-DFI.2.22]MCB7073229.1 methylmalonyl-CoA epimerase [Caldibacillus sp. 210928-DFI.2.18]MCM3477210.1 methylmalonyl-CoA epimerase [Caldibacillus thermoamylovorans]MEC5270524.1 methylmalonyl-CoA epimerase [Caldifermentibacillus hisashii]